MTEIVRIIRNLQIRFGTETGNFGHDIITGIFKFSIGDSSMQSFQLLLQSAFDIGIETMNSLPQYDHSLELGNTV